MEKIKEGKFRPIDVAGKKVSEGEKWLTDFQTPVPVCNFMASLIPKGTQTILEPTAGVGNLLRAIPAGCKVTAPSNFFSMNPARFDCVIMNPPFSSKYAFGVPVECNKYGMRLGYHILKECMKMSDNVIALMPWFTISDSDVRLRQLYRFGLVSIIALPRATFQYARIQTMILQLKKDWKSDTVFKVFDARDDGSKIKLWS
jgi:type I restriction-modification system DNA methylase subunit